MRLDTKGSLRTLLCLPNRSRVQAATWGSCGNLEKGSLRTLLCLPNRSRVQAAT